MRLELAHEVVHARLDLCELHLVHPARGEVVDERLASEHSSELLRVELEALLHSG